MQKVNITLRKDYKNKCGYEPLYIRTMFGTVKKDISLRIFINRKYWDNKLHQVTQEHDDFERINKYISKEVQKARKIIDDFYFADKPLAADEFTRIYFYKGYADGSFTEYISEQIKKRNLSKETQRTYKSQITKLEQFSKGVKFADLTYTFLKDYENYMFQTLKNNKNTASKCMSMLRTFVGWCIDADLIKSNPFEKIKIKKFKGNREHLTPEELKTLEELYKAGTLKAGRHYVLKYFLFSCYTGLRYTDVKDFTFGNIYGTGKNTVIKLEQHKTKFVVSIPVLSKANELIGKNYGKNEKVFKVLTNQKTNENLKEIMKTAGINKYVSFHVARHTFATNAIFYGIPVEIISSILGHTEISTTQIYAKTTDKLKTEWIRKME